MTLQCETFTFDDVPPPSKASELLQAIRAIKVGEGLLVKDKTPHQVKHAVQSARAQGMFFRTQAMTTGVRVWRLE